MGIYPLTNKGIHFKSFQDEDEAHEIEKQKLKFDAKNAERIYKTYWLTLGIAVAGFAISIILLILKLKE